MKFYSWVRKLMQEGSGQRILGILEQVFIIPIKDQLSKIKFPLTYRLKNKPLDKPKSSK